MPVLYCPPEAVDAATAACSSPQWVEFPGLLPPLTVEQGFQIAGAIGVVWALGYIGRLIRYALRGHIR